MWTKHVGDSLTEFFSSTNVKMGQILWKLFCHRFCEWNVFLICETENGFQWKCCWFLSSSDWLSEMIAAAWKSYDFTAWCVSHWTPLSFSPPSGWYRGHRLRRKSKKVRSFAPPSRCPVCVSDRVVVLVFDFHFLFQGIFPACYIHLKEATVEGSGWELFHSCGVFLPTCLFSCSEL